MTRVQPRRTAGRQTRRQRKDHWLAIAILGPLSVALLGFAIWAILTRPGGADSNEAAWGGALMVATALLLGGGAWHSWHKLHPPQLKNVRLAVTPLELRRGGQVRATITCTRSRRPDTTLELVLLCLEHYDVEKVQTSEDGDNVHRVTEEHELQREAIPIDGASTDASFDVPADAPFSYAGDCISAEWQVRAVERRPNRRDRHREQEVWVLS